MLCCALRQSTLSTLSQSIHSKLGTGLRWGVKLQWTGVPSRGSGVNDSLPLSTTETGDKHWPFVPSWYGEWFILTKFKNDKTDFLVWRLSYNCYLIRHVSTHVKWLWYHWEFKPNLFNFITEFCNFGPRQLIIIFHQS